MRQHETANPGVPVILLRGEAQRVSIARALYTEPEILVFDEATSSLDSTSEGIIQQTIDSLRSKVTTMIIAHRLSTVKQCDRIVLMRNGGISMVGPPEEAFKAYADERRRLRILARRRR